MPESNKSQYRATFLIPSSKYGAYWIPILAETSQYFSDVICYTGELPNNFNSRAPGASLFQLIGETRKLNLVQIKDGYSRGFLITSPSIIGYLLRFKPHVIFASGFSFWTLLSLLFKPLGKWQVVVICDGSSPNIDFRNSKFRILFRQWMSKLTDKFIANNQNTKDYLIEVIGVEKTNIDVITYLVPDIRTLSKCTDSSNPIQTKSFFHPVFLFVGQVVHRKGLHLLISACALLKKQGYNDYTLIVAGDGEQKQEFIAFCDTHGLSELIHWVGWVDYECLGTYFETADVLIFPTMEDIWGMVVLEAMAFGKPVICSKWAGVAGIIDQGKTGYIVDPHNVEELAGTMRHFIENPELIPIMGKQAHQSVNQYTPEIAAKFLSNSALKILSPNIK